MKAALLGAAVFVAVNIVIHSRPNRADVYALRVQVLDPDGNAVRGAAVRVSQGNEPQSLPDGWWEIEIPDSKLSIDRTVWLNVEHPDWGASETSVRLGKDRNPRARVQLAPPRSVLGGRIVGTAGKGVAGVKVWAVEYAGSAQGISNADGRFRFALPVSPGTTLRVRVGYPGLRPEDDVFCQTGQTGCLIDVAAIEP